MTTKGSRNREPFVVNSICLLVNGDELVALGADAKLFGCGEDMQSMTRVDALDEMFPAGVFGFEHLIDAGTVESDRIERGEDADVAHFGFLGIAVAVAVNRQTVGYIYIENVFAGVVGHGFGCIRHAFKECVLLGYVVPYRVRIVGLAAGVDIGLAFR